jgi:hypothetical protein
VVLSMKDHFKLVAQCETSKTLNTTGSIHKLNETNVKLRETQDIASLVTHDLGLLAKQLETIVDARTSVAATKKITVTRTPMS